ncbi:hypothetical protein BJF90_23770 [Pseudonocardia sp. CNS-004]|nr:hypothetical protein BJF90_23770 [Pseudonocardia sp. CNS-004]
MSSFVSWVRTAAIPHPMSTPTLAGITARTVGITLPAPPVRVGNEDRGEDPPGPSRAGPVRQERFEHLQHAFLQLPQLVVGQPQRGLPHADAVPQRVEVVPRQVAVEVTGEPREVDGEHRPQPVAVGRLVVRIGRGRVERVGPLHRAPYPALVGHDQYARVHQHADVPVQGGRGRVRHQLGKLAGGQ